MARRLLTVLFLIALVGIVRAEGDVLASPVRIAAGGRMIDVDGGHAAPHVCDWDSDGRPDLLVGQFGSGELLIFRNVGTRQRPRLAAPTTFRAGGVDGTVPSG